MTSSALYLCDSALVPCLPFPFPPRSPVLAIRSSIPCHTTLPIHLTRAKVKVQISTSIAIIRRRSRRCIPTRLITRITEIPRTVLARDGSVSIRGELARRPCTSQLVVQSPICTGREGIVELCVRLGHVGAEPSFQSDAGVGDDGFDVNVAGGDAEDGGGVELVDVLDVDGEGAVVGDVGVAVLGGGGGGEGGGEGEEGENGLGHCGGRDWLIGMKKMIESLRLVDGD